MLPLPRCPQRCHPPRCHLVPVLQSFREELESLIQEQMKKGNNSSHVWALRQIADFMATTSPAALPTSPMGTWGRGRGTLGTLTRDLIEEGGWEKPQNLWGHKNLWDLQGHQMLWDHQAFGTLRPPKTFAVIKPLGAPKLLRS